MATERSLVVLRRGEKSTGVTESAWPSGVSSVSSAILSHHSVATAEDPAKAEALAKLAERFVGSQTVSRQVHRVRSGEPLLIPRPWREEVSLGLSSRALPNAIALVYEAWVAVLRLC
jgi:hypothetical protein